MDIVEAAPRKKCIRSWKIYLERKIWTNMKTTGSIPTSKLKRAGKILKTGLKVGTNYASYFGEKLIHPDITKEKLDRKNAEDIMGKSSRA